jgi:hypothetical protein
MHFILIGLIVAAFPGEISNQALVRHDILAFVFAMLFYIFFIGMAYFVTKGLDRYIQSQFFAALLFFLLYGCVGLMIEWFVLGIYTLDFSNPAQFFMFLFWGSIVLLPKLFFDPALQILKKRLRWYLLLWSVVAFLPFIIASLLGSDTEATRRYALFAWSIGEFGVLYFIIVYLRALKKRE